MNFICMLVLYEDLNALVFKMYSHVFKNSTYISKFIDLSFKSMRLIYIYTLD